MFIASTLQKEGELRKYKNLWSGWGKRYFKLERMYLHYFESKDVSTIPKASHNCGPLDRKLCVVNLIFFVC